MPPKIMHVTLLTPHARTHARTTIVAGQPGRCSCFNLIQHAQAFNAVPTALPGGSLGLGLQFNR